MQPKHGMGRGDADQGDNHLVSTTTISTLLSTSAHNDNSFVDGSFRVLGPAALRFYKILVCLNERIHKKTGLLQPGTGELLVILNRYYIDSSRDFKDAFALGQLISQSTSLRAHHCH